MTFRLLGMPEELRLAIEQAGGEPTEEARLLYEASAVQTEQAIEYALREIQSVIGPHGAVSRLQAGGIRITPGVGIGVYEGGILKTTILPDGNFRVGSDTNEPATTTFCCFVNEQVYNSEVMGAGDLLIGDNTTAQSNVKYDASDGQLQFRYGTTVRAYMDTDGSIKAGAGVVDIDNTGISIDAGTAQADLNSYKFDNNDATIGGLYGWMVAGNVFLTLQSVNNGGSIGQLELKAEGDSYGLLYLRANNDTGADVEIAISSGFSTSSIEINALGVDVDTLIKGLTDDSLFKADAGLDAIGMGGAAESGYKLKVTGSAKVTDGFTWDGWDKRAETWTRTGNHTFTVSGDLTAMFRKGSKVRYKDGGSFEYGVISSSSHSAGTTTVTLITNTDYTMAAATITDKYISYIENPEGFPNKFNFTSTVTYVAGTTDPTSVTVNTAYWRVFNSEFYTTIKATLVRGAGDRVQTIFSIPVSAVALSPIPGLDSITAAGTGMPIACYFNGTSIVYEKTMTQNGDYFINGSTTF